VGAINTPRGRRKATGRGFLTFCLGSSLALAGWPGGESALASSETADRIARTAETALATAREMAGAEAAAPGAILGALMFYDPVQDLAGGVDGAAYGPSDRAWVEAALAVYDLYRQIGGESGDRRYLFRRDGDRVFVGVEGGAGHWRASVEEGQAGFLGLLARSSRALPESLRLAVSQGADRPLGALAADLVVALSKPGGVLLIPRGAARTVRVEEAWHAVGTAGLAVSAVPTGKGGLVATVRPRPGPHTGPQAIVTFRRGRRFTASETIEVAVGTDAGSGTGGDAAATRATARPDHLDLGNPAPVPDGIAASGETRRYAISVPAAGGYRITSSGPSDIVGQLTGPDGAVIARDDDGGLGYNFTLEANLEAGDYTLEVIHCCAGTGPFALTVTTK
jgi:hypothetical protein